MRPIHRQYMADGTVRATYRPNPLASRVRHLLAYLGLVPGYPEPRDD